MTIQPAAQQAITPQAQHIAQTASAPETATTAKAATAAKPQADTVTISKQAMLMNSPGYSAGEEMAEKVKGQR